ncbi:hypothetical protein BaRGS_00036585 [Batillaria attramentaria]|uniref:NADAR domain-containing protein n=1 Tax=Batillaria attramentaria TaxID=370345 RepID=A0ABD0JBH2_9CAEN
MAATTTTTAAVTTPTVKPLVKAGGQKEEFEFFYGKNSPFSQHYPVKFEVDGVTYNCAEQYMMHQKAVVFKDSEMSGKIMATSNPVEQKRYGRKVRNFDKDVWSRRAPKVVRAASKAKFSQNEKLLKKLLATHPRTLVEASPRDRLWGIGLGASNPKARDRKQWRGKNLLGQILTEVRDELMKEEEDDENSD